jgi:hypothetical protein
MLKLTNTIREKLGIKRRGRPVGTGSGPALLPQIAAMLESGYTQTQIAKEFGLSRQRIWAIVNNDKFKAQKLVRVAILRGELSVPDQCEKCGRASRLEAHHDDYSKPLAVLWLCKSCHVAELPESYSK